MSYHIINHEFFETMIDYSPNLMKHDSIFVVIC
jgi:hypothetical protein